MFRCKGISSYNVPFDSSSGKGFDGMPVQAGTDEVCNKQNIISLSNIIFAQNFRALTDEKITPCPKY